MNHVNDSVNYILFGNPLSHGIISAGSNVIRSAGKLMPNSANSNLGTKTSNATTNIMTNTIPLWKMLGQNIWIVRLAGLSGATAVILGAYGSHRTYNEEKGQSKLIFETANKYHFFHSITLMVVPLCRKPMLTGSLMAMGTLLFTGPCYYRAFSGNSDYSKIAPIGGFCLILAWLSMVL